MCIISVGKKTTPPQKKSGLTLYKTHISSCINVHKLWSEPEHHWSNQCIKTAVMYNWWAGHITKDAPPSQTELWARSQGKFGVRVTAMRPEFVNKP